MADESAIAKQKMLSAFNAVEDDGDLFESKPEGECEHEKGLTEEEKYVAVTLCVHIPIEQPRRKSADCERNSGNLSLRTPFSVTIGRTKSVWTTGRSSCESIS